MLAKAGFSAFTEWPMLLAGMSHIVTAKLLQTKGRYDRAATDFVQQPYRHHAYAD